jgi:DNA gyrase subunit A
MAQWWCNSIPLIEGSGNFGTIAGDPAGADRYIKARLSDFASACFFEDWKDAVVDMDMAYDEETKEPRYLPAKYPNVLLNGCLGIGYGVSTNLFPCNFKELVNATIALMKDPHYTVVLIPDSPTGADIIEMDFANLCNRGVGSYSMRCRYEIDAAENMIRITNVPYMSPVNAIIEKIAEIKEQGGLAELTNMVDMTAKECDLRLYIRDDINPYKFMKKLISLVPGLEKTYPVTVTVTNDYQSVDYSITRVLLEWINWRREQKRSVLLNKYTRLYAEQRTNDVKIFLMDKSNLKDTIDIFKNNRNRAAIEAALITKYKNTEIKMDSMQARTLSNLRLVDLSQEAYEECLKKREELIKEIKELNDQLNTKDGVDKVIIDELLDGAKRFGTPRKSRVVPKEISVSSEVKGSCILQLSSDGMILRRPATNVDEEPIPTDSNGFAVKVDNDASFILINDMGYHTFIKVKDVPVDSEVPVIRYAKFNIDTSKIVAMLPCDIESNLSCTLISKNGVMKRIRVADMGPSKKPCIDIGQDDRLVKGIITNIKSSKDLLVYTKEGRGQRLDPNNIRITSPLAKGGNGFKLLKGDEIIGCYRIDPEENQYLLYITAKGKIRLNDISYLPTRDSKHDAMVSLISLNDRDKLVSIIGCNRHDKLQVFYDDQTSEIIDISKIEVSTMGSEPKKLTTKNAVSNNIVKAKIV